MVSHILESVSGLANFSLYFFSAVVLLIVFSYIYGMVTPYPEIRLIREGKMAPAISYGGAVFGFICPLVSAISHSVSFIDMLIWAFIALLIQILVFLVLKTVFSSLVEDVSQDKISSAIFLSVFSVAVGLLNAASMSY